MHADNRDAEELNQRKDELDGKCDDSDNIHMRETSVDTLKIRKNNTEN